jgi:hypothetical protein
VQEVDDLPETDAIDQVTDGAAEDEASASAESRSPGASLRKN